ncbi:MAG: CHAT domain-containing protein [Candidatus Krumholzibacteria bacterium]|nr:CHAT domain-containing protein [Candidatus Krumholzibacteria bacterium]
MKRRSAATALLFLAAAVLLQFSTVSRTGTDRRYMINPASIYRADPGEMSFLLMPGDEALEVFRGADYDDCSKILNTFTEIYFMKRLAEAEERCTVLEDETGRIAQMISEAFDTPHRFEAFQRQAAWPRKLIRMKLEGDERFAKCARRIYGGDLSPEIPAILEGDIGLMLREGADCENGHYLDLMATYYFAMKDDARAFESLCRAGEIFSRCGNKAAMAQFTGRMGEYFKRKGKPEKAEEYLMQSLAIALGMDEPYYAARAYSFLGSMRRDQGFFFEAESLFTQSLACCERSTRIDCRKSQYISLARLYYDFGQPGLSEYYLELAMGEIETIRRGIRESYSPTHDVYLENSASSSLGTCLSLKTRILMGRGEFEGAVKTMEATLPLIDRGLDRHMEAELERQLGDVYTAAGRFGDARRFYARAIETSRRLGESREIAGHLTALTLLHLETGDMDKAEESALEAVRQASGSGDWAARSAALHASGLVEIGKGRAAEGYDLLRSAVAIFENGYASRNVAAGKRAMESDLNGIYCDIFALQAEEFNNVDSLLWWAEKRRGAAASGPGAAGFGADGTAGWEIGDLSWIPPEAAVIQYVVTPGKLYVVASVAGGRVLVPVDISSAVLRESTSRFLSLCSPHCEKPAGAPGPRPTLEEAASDLYDILVRPVSESLDGKSIVCFIPDGPLHYLPFHALIDGRGAPRFLAERLDVTTSGSLAGLRRRTAPGTGAAPGDGFRHPLLVGALEYSPLAKRIFPEVVDLPGSASEIERAARLLDGETLLDGRDATKEEFILRAPGADLVLISTHTIEYPVFSGETALLFSPATGARSEMDVSRAILTADEIGGMDLSGSKLVVLAACESACGRMGSNAGGPGLSEAFSRAGAPVVLSSLWRIGDEAAQSFVCRFLDELAGGADAAGAVRCARMKAISEAREAGDLSADIEGWAPFTLLAPLPRPGETRATDHKNR